MTQHPDHSLELRTLIDEDGAFSLFLDRVSVPAPKAGEVLVRVEAAPINPSDIALLMGPVDPATLAAGKNDHGPTLTGSVPEGRLAAVKGRLGQAMAAGNEGAGTIVAAGEGAEGLLGRTVAVFGGAMYTEYKVVRARDVMPLNEGTTAADGAAAFVNPLTALNMVETMRREGHKALVHTAAASNLGQMMVRLCAAEDVPLVNIVRKQEQVTLLRNLGATHVLDSSADGFNTALVAALKETGATLAFDAIGGGRMAADILAAMEQAAQARMGGYSRYGSSEPKQVYIYGRLDLSPTTLDARSGMIWGVGGWLLLNAMSKAAPETLTAQRQRVAAEITTTFASHYTARVSLAEMLSPEVAAGWNRRATGEKYLVTPHAD